MGKKKKEELVNLDEGENWIVTSRKNKLKALGWTGTLGEWQDAMELLDANPLELEPPVTSLDAARARASKK